MSLNAFKDYLLMERMASAHTLKAYLRDLTSFAEFLQEQYQVSVDSAQYIHVRAWMVFLMDHGNKHQTINRKISSLKAYYQFLLKTGWLTLSPLEVHQSLKSRPKLSLPFSINEMNALFDQWGSQITQLDFDESRNRLVLALLYGTGIRRAELTGLNLIDVDLDRAQIKVLGKRNKERLVPLIESLIPMLKYYLNQRSELSLHQETHSLFVMSDGRKLSDSFVYRLVNRYLSEVTSKEKRSPHMLRHTFATHVLQSGADLNSVKELLGHSSLAATQVYTHNSIEDLKKSYRGAHPRSTKK
ncbi:MAG TPA: integrase [Flavobacteriaceae bacterium]|jgi:integrase/recombinase XerC|nr:integrase [Flavobacteriaceae bacterium]